MTFSDFIGNARAVSVASRMLKEGRFPPALLLAGQKGVGKFTLARLIAQAANCEQGAGAICESCKACRSIDALADLAALKEAAVQQRGSASPEENPLVLRPHPNVTVLVPDGAFIRVSQMRYVVRKAYHQPTGGGRLIFIIDEAERLRGELADVLLKVLEEPPARTSLILVTHEPNLLRATIRSRCITLTLGPIPTPQIATRLESDRAAWSPPDRALAAAVASGSLGTALSLDLERYKAVRPHALEVLRTAALRRLNTERLFDATGALAGKAASREGGTATESNPAQAFDFGLDLLYSLVNDVLYLKAGGPKDALRNPDLIGELRELSSRAADTWMADTVRQLDRLHGWRRRNINRQLALDAMALRVSRTESPE